MKKFLLLSLFTGILIAAWQLTVPLFAAAPPPGPTREESISNLQNIIISSGQPETEVNANIPFANQVWDAAQAKGLDPKTTNQLLLNIYERPVEMVGPAATAAVNVINSTDFSSAPISPVAKGDVIANLSVGQVMGLAPESLQKMSNTLVEVASDPRISQGNDILNLRVINTVAAGMGLGLDADQAKQRGEAIVSIGQQLSAQGLSDSQVSTGLIAAMNGMNSDATPEQALQVAIQTIAAENGGASNLAVLSTSPTITEAVKTGVDVQNVATAATATFQETTTTQQSSVAGTVAGNTTGTAIIQGIPTDRASLMGTQAGEMVAQLQQEFGALPASIAGGTVSAGIINQQNDQLVDNAGRFVATQAAELANNGQPIAVVQTAELGGQGILQGQTEDQAQLAVSVAAQSAATQLENGAGTLAAGMSADTAANTVFQAGGQSNPETPLEQQPDTEGVEVQTDQVGPPAPLTNLEETPPAVNPEQPAPSGVDEPVPNPPVPVEPPPPINDQPVASDQP